MKYLFCLLFCTQILAQNNEKAPAYASLLTDMDVQIDMTDAVNNMYNFKFEKADSAFKQLRNKYPKHPMAYFLLGLSCFWKMQPNTDITTYDDQLLAYMDSSIMYGEPMTKSSEEVIKVEGGFFCAAANGFKARNLSDRGHIMKALPAGKDAMHYMNESKNNSDLSPEFLFGDGLYNFYREYIPKNFKVFAPIMTLFPSGNMKLGLEQLDFCANNAFYTRTEAQYYLMYIYTVEEVNVKAALPYSKYLYTTYPDNPIFQRFYCRLIWSSGYFLETERVGLSIIAKIDSGYPGYEEFSGRYASYILGYVYNFKKDFEKAKHYYKRTVVFSEKINAYDMAFYHSACLNLGKLYAKEGNIAEACFYYSKFKKHVDKDENEANFNEAKEFLKAHDCKKHEN
jgi:tetratricopeptide (TPR) repeat protein